MSLRRGQFQVDGELRGASSRRACWNRAVREHMEERTCIDEPLYRTLTGS